MEQTTSRCLRLGGSYMRTLLSLTCNLTLFLLQRLIIMREDNIDSMSYSLLSDDVQNN